MSAGHTPGPWVAHGAFYTHGFKGDVFAKDARDVYDCTPICRVVQPVSHRQHKAGGRPIDALHATAKRKEQAPVIEANARLIASAPELLEALQGLLDALARRFPGQPITSSEIFGPAVMQADAAIAKATQP